MIADRAASPTGDLLPNWHLLLHGRNIRGALRAAYYDACQQKCRTVRR